MIIVSNASVLIGLSSISMLNLLRKRFPGGILVPESVWREVVVEGGERPGAKEVAAADWITLQYVGDKRLVRLLRAELDEGEAEAISLAFELKADAVLLDERDARQVAKRMNLKVLGTIGILVWAKKAGRIIRLKDHLNALQIKGKFRITQYLYNEALREVNELE